jgi:hypothetical protein
MEAKHKHLEFIQNTITRMTKNSFLLKGWSITITAGLFALNNNLSSDILLISYLLTLFFWLLDAYYLLQERLFIELYNNVRKKNENDIDFSMHTKEFCGEERTFPRTFLSITTIVFYGGLMAVILLGMLIIK